MLARQRYLLDYTLAALLRRKGRNLSLLLVYGALVFALASVLLFGSALRREARALLEGAPELTVQRLVAGRHDPIPAAYLEEVRKIRGVAAAEPRLWGYHYDPASGANYTVLVPAADPPPAGSARIGRGVARSRGLAVGDVVAFRDTRGEPLALRVTDLLDPASELLTADLFLVAEGDFRRWLGVPEGLYTDLALRVRNAREVRTVADKVTRALPDTRPVLREEVARTYEAVFAWREGVGLLLLSAALFAFAIFAWDRASGLSAEERREIGILKAVGWDTGDVLRMKLWEGAVVSLTAFLVGYVLAYAHVFWAGAPLLAPLLKGWATLYPEFRLVPHVEPAGVLALFALTVVPYTAVTLVPTWRAAVADPDAVMRGAQE